MTALLDGVYDGGVTYADLESHGDFGLGTFNASEGEMIAVDGAHADGSVDPVRPEESTPIAAVTFIRETSSTTARARSADNTSKRYSTS